MSRTKKLRRVTASEADLVMLTRAMVSAAPGPLVAEYCHSPPSAADGLSRAALELLQQTLATAFVRRCAVGGWRQEAFVDAGRVVRGRLWQRHGRERLGVSFSTMAVRFLMWLQSAGRSGPACPLAEPCGEGATLEVGDDWLVWEAYRSLRETAVGERLREESTIQNHVLVRLGFPFDGWTEPPDRSAWSDWTAPQRAWLLEALQEHLRRDTLHWNAQAIRAGGTESDVDALVAAKALTEAIDCMAHDGRLDLLQFFLRALSDPCRDMPAHSAVEAPLAERLSPALIDVLFALREQSERCRQVAYYDEAYAAAQRWLQAWERSAGEPLCQAVRAAVRSSAAESLVARPPA